MALDKAKKHLEKFGFDDRIIIFDEYEVPLIRK